MTSQTNENRQGNRGTKSTGTFLREAINLSADGYVYHPRFFLFLTKLSGGLNEGFNSGDPNVASRSTTGSLDYELRGVFLPEHPYNLELFKLHHEASAPGSFLRGQRGTMDQQGAIFSYKERPWSFSSSYTEGSVDSEANRTDSKAYRVFGGYHGSVVSNTASYNHTVATSSNAAVTTHDSYGFGNNIRIARIILDSRVNDTTIDQTQPVTPEFQSRTFSWTEHLTAPLPWNFSTNASYGYQNERDRTGESVVNPAREEFNRSTTTSVNLNHRLYQSITTNYNFNNTLTKSSSGTLTSRSNSLSSTYTKALPSSRLTTGIVIAESDAERQGTPSVLNEVHSAALFGTFSLDQQNVLADTIVIQVKDPVTGALITLPASDYLVAARGDITQIAVLSVFPATLQTDPAALYEFHVSYTLSQESKISTTSHGFSFKLDLLDGLLTPYYNYFSSNQELVSGSLAGGPDRTANETAGVTTQVGPYSGLIEHQSYRSRHNPYETWKTRAEYRRPIGTDTNMSSQISYARTDYFPTESVASGIREKIISAGVNVNTRFPHRNVGLFGSGTYTRNRSFIDSDTITINSYLTWQRGLLSANGGVQLSRVESQTPTGKTTLMSQVYYVTLTRQLF